jgi:hypothetical protein
LAEWVLFDSFKAAGRYPDMILSGHRRRIGLPRPLNFGSLLWSQRILIRHGLSAQ